MRRLIVVLGSLATLALAPAAARAQGGSLSGRVSTPTGGAIPGARVQVAGTGRTAVTSGDGRYEIVNLPAGSWAAMASAYGYASSRQQATITAGTVTILNFTLTESAVALAPLQAIVGSRAQHTAEDELAVPVDVISSTVIAEQGVTETAQILQAVSPSVNFFHQSVSDATDVVRPFTLRGLSPDQTLVLVNGKRYHRTALVHIFGAGMGAGSSGVDMNTIPASAIDRIEVLRDGAAAQYGSDAIAGVVNLVLKRGVFAPTLTVGGGRYQPNEWSPDGASFDAAGSWGLKLGRGWVTLMGELRDRRATNRAGADYEDQIVPGDADEVDENGRIITKNNPVAQPTYHWGDGSQRDWLGFVNALVPLDRQANTQLYAFGGTRRTTGAATWPPTWTSRPTSRRACWPTRPRAGSTTATSAAG